MISSVGTAHAAEPPTIDVSACSSATSSCVVELLRDGRLQQVTPWFSESGASDPQQVYQRDGNRLRVTGEVLGAAITDAAYRNYAAVLEYRWGERTWPPRESRARDAGLFVHSRGVPGGAQGYWMGGIQAQMLEGGNGDLVLLAGRDDADRPLAPALTASVEQRVCLHDNWSCRGGFVWAPTGSSRRFANDLAAVHWRDWDLSWQDRLGFRGEDDPEAPVGGWNQMQIVVDEDRLQVWFNGRLVNEASEVSPTTGRVQLESEYAEFVVRRWELWPLWARPESVQPLSILGNALPQAAVGRNYDVAIATIGEVSAVGWQVDSGELPPGLSLDPADGRVTGRPLAPGSHAFTLRVDDASRQYDAHAFSLQVVEADPPLGSGSDPALEPDSDTGSGTDAASGSEPEWGAGYGAEAADDEANGDPMSGSGGGGAAMLWLLIGPWLRMSRLRAVTGCRVFPIGTPVHH